MKVEFEKRKASNFYDKFVDLETLQYKDLLDIAEASAVDLICLLPADILLERNNLDEIIARAIRSLSGIYNKEEFNIYSLEQARSIVRKLEVVFDKFIKDAHYNYN
ncbi:MAG: hypothetical protein JW995_06185 [Melioribacteraceae bacterium]|nr:hypothetical protein [Melioribacteraceae bacterium]